MDEQRSFTTGTAPATPPEHSARLDAMERRADLPQLHGTDPLSSTIRGWNYDMGVKLSETDICSLARDLIQRVPLASPDAAPGGWREMDDAPRGVPIWALHPADHIPGGWWAATVILGDDTDENPFDTILHYNGQTLLASFRGVFRYWQPIASPRPDDQAAPGGWREIESAPKVYQPVLVAFDKGRHGDIHRAPAIAAWHERGSYWGHWDSGLMLSAQPIAWQPLPAPPGTVSPLPEDKGRADIAAERGRAGKRAVEWRPMDTAPRDGTEIILAFGQDGTSQGWYDQNLDLPHPWCFIDCDGPRRFINRARDDQYGPSHWQPMPSWFAPEWADIAAEVPEGRLQPIDPGFDDPEPWPHEWKRRAIAAEAALAASRAELDEEADAHATLKTEFVHVSEQLAAARAEIERLKEGLYRGKDWDDLKAERDASRAEVERWRELQEKTHAEVIEHVCLRAELDSELNVLRAQVTLLAEIHEIANRALRSAWAIAEREGRQTNWRGHREQLRESLEASHAAMAALAAHRSGSAKGGEARAALSQEGG